MFSNLGHSFFQNEKDETEKDETEHEEGGAGGGGIKSVKVGRVREGNKYKNTLKKEKYINTLYDDDFITNYFL
jgi:hypothetical protein